MIRAIPYTSLWFGTLMWGLITLGVLSGTAWNLHQNYLFAYDAKPAVAKVTRMDVSVSHGRHGSSYTHHLYYQYNAGAYSFEAESNVSSNTYYSVAVGREIPILYVADQLSDNRIELPQEIENVKVLTVVLIIASLALGIAGFFVLRYYIRLNRQQKWLVTNGRQTQGTVSSVDYVTGAKGSRRYFLRLQFRDNLGREIDGRSGNLSLFRQSSWGPGSKVLVYFDPANSERFTLNLSRPVG